MIVQLDDADLPALVAHIARHGAESGNDGDLIFRPRSAGTATIDDMATIERHKIGWAQPLHEPLWLRTWGVGIGRQIIGHLDLYGGRMPSEAHRCLLGMGIERDHRGRGHGRGLLEVAIAWARAAGLSWIDLGVFAHNPRARRLYESVGFETVGVVADRYRVDDRSIDDVSMALKL